MFALVVSDVCASRQCCWPSTLPSMMFTQLVIFDPLRMFTVDWNWRLATLLKRNLFVVIR